MKEKFVRLLTLALLAMPISAVAIPFTLQFSASGFVNGGVQYPGFSGPISGSFSWDANNTNELLSTLTSINLAIGGHQYALGEVGVGSQGSTQSTVGGLFNSVNAVIGSGLDDDFLIVFDRVNPQIVAFAYAIEGKFEAIWWLPTSTEIHYVSSVPEPASIALFGLALAGLASSRRRRASCCLKAPYRA